MNDPRPSFPFYPADFWGADLVALMDFEAVGLYWFLLSREWQNGPLPDDEALLERLCRGRVRDWKACWSQVSPCFDRVDGRLLNRRLEEERAVADQFSMRQSGAAKARWERWKADRECHGNATAMPPHSHGNAGAMPRTGQDRTGLDETGQNSPQPPPGGEPQVAALPEPKPKKPRKVRIDPATYPLPASLDFPDVRQALVEYNRTRKGGVWDVDLAAIRVRELTAWGRPRAVAALLHSAGYQGLFEPHGKPSYSAPQPPPKTPIESFVPDPAELARIERAYGRGPNPTPKPIVDPARSQVPYAANGKAV